MIFFPFCSCKAIRDFWEVKLQTSCQQEKEAPALLATHRAEVLRYGNFLVFLPILFTILSGCQLVSQKDPSLVACSVISALRYLRVDQRNSSYSGAEQTLKTDSSHRQWFPFAKGTFDPQVFLTVVVRREKVGKEGRNQEREGICFSSCGRSLPIISHFMSSHCLGSSMKRC